ncbi:MAG: lysyl-tRNA synthetase, class, partial [Mycobacterium sp.]|nr:lysyl-tRNA synthetase, class [Mycobacterium sp.]
MTVTRPSTTRARSRYWWVPAASGWTVGVIATLSLIASVSPGIRWLLKEPREFVNDYIFNFPDTSFAWAFVLALLAAALAARKRIAWWILVGYMIAATAWNIGGLITSPKVVMDDIGEVIGLVFHVAAILVLVLARKQFWAKVRRAALVKAVATLIASMAVGTLIGWALLELFPGTLAREDRFLYALNRVSAFAGAASDSFSGHPHVFINALLGLFGALALMVTAIVLFRSQRADNALTGEDESAIRGLLELFGKNDSLGYFATRRDKAVVFAPNGRAAITYRVEVGVCLASGDPVGDPKAWQQAIAAWLALCQTYGWAPGVMGASSTGAEAFRQAGLNALKLGDEAILYPDTFRLSGPDMRAVRQAVTRAKRAGAAVRIRRHRDLGTEEMAQMTARADAWRDTETERGFSMALGRLGDPADGDCLLVEAVQSVSGKDEVVAMLSLVPWGANGASLDLMRRSPQSPNGSIELMVSELCLQSEDIGVNRISLNFAMFRTAFEQGAQLGAGPIARLWRGLLVFFSRWWQLETLYRSNMKYQPQWVPRYACYEDARLVPRVGVASVIAEGFLVLPFSRRNEQAHTGHHISAPENLVATGLLRHDGSAPDLGELQADLPEADEQTRLPEQVRVRMAKLKALQDSGVDAYPVGEEPSHTVAQAVDAGDDEDVTVSGRVMRIRDYGGVLFAQLRDWSGEVQLLLDNSLLNKGTVADFTSALDLGDLIEVSGSMGRSKKGTRSLIVRGWRLIGKCLRPLPD